MSLESSGFPLAVRSPATTQLLDPAAQSLQEGRPSIAARLRGTRLEGAVKAGKGIGGAAAPVSSGGLMAAGCGDCGLLRSMTIPLGGWSRQEPTGKRSDSSFAFFRRAPTLARSSLVRM